MAPRKKSSGEIRFRSRCAGPGFLGKDELEDLYSDSTIAELDLEALRERSFVAPCCTTNAGASSLGDPINLVIIECEAGLLPPLIERGWHMTQKLDAASRFETARAFVFEDTYQTSPVSPLYMFGRREDIALQKARSTINERIHLRRMAGRPRSFLAGECGSAR